MRIVRSWRLWLGLLLAGTAAPLAAQADNEVEGIYQDEVFEIGSTLVLSPSGRFLWFFSMGALDMAAQGRWTRQSDGTVRLDSDPPVHPPRFELVGRSRGDAPGVAVRLACDSRQAAQFLDILVEYADGERMADRFSGVEYRTSADPARRVAAVQVGSEVFDLLSDRFPVDPGEANILTIRFVPNDLGRADFRGQVVNVAEGGLSFAWRGMDLRYTREGSAAGQALPDLPAVPGSGGEAAPFPLEVRVGEPIDAVRARAREGLTLADGLLVAQGPVDLRLAAGGEAIDVGRVEGGSRPLMIASDHRDKSVGTVAFAYPPAFLPLGEALARARTLQAWLERSGFGFLPGADQLGDPPPFTTSPSDGSEGATAASWEEAGQWLADESRAVSAMELYTVRSPTHMASVRLENARRHEVETCAHAEWAGERGREWRLLVTIGQSLAPVMEEMAVEP